jgi:hypothetical protein
MPLNLLHLNQSPRIARLRLNIFFLLVFHFLFLGFLHAQLDRSFLSGEELSFSLQENNDLTEKDDSLSKISSLPGLTGWVQRPELEIDSLGSNIREQPAKLTMFGYYRLFLYGRNMREPYPNLSPFEKAYGVGDGYREPMLSLNVLHRPNGRSSFGTELYVFTPYSGEGFEENDFTLNLGLNFYGNFRTDFGKFGIRAGGIHWYNLSSFTIGIYQVLDRFSIFDRTPWEGVDNTGKYENYFKSGAVDVGDDRWNTQAFQGLILNGADLPGGLGFDLFWGKTGVLGGLPEAEDDPLNTIFNLGTAGNVPTYQGFNGNARVLPALLYGGKLTRAFDKGRQRISLNSVNSYRTLDSEPSVNYTTTPQDTFFTIGDSERETYSVHTLSFDLNIKKLNISGEIGASNYYISTYDPDWGEALMMRIRTPKEYTFLPLDIQLYQISKDFYNENGEIASNSNPQIQNPASQDFQVIAGQASVGGLITQVNQLAHNRRGINVNTGFELGPAKINIGWGFAAEIDTLTTQLTYVHRVNGLALSRIYNPFPANAVQATNFGPNGRKFSFFRGAFEVVQTTDIDPATAGPTNRKYFNAIDLQAKVKQYLFDRPIYLFYLGTFGSAQSAADFLPRLDDESYLFVQYHELDIYYELFPRFILTGYVGVERAQGGRLTEWGPESQQPRDQLATGIGTGFDWMIADNAGLYLRYRWMEFEDRNLVVDRYRGEEATIELKIFF